MNIILTFDCERNWLPGAITRYEFPYSKEPDFSQLKQVMPGLLSILDRHNARGTFFLTGEAAEHVSIFKDIPYEVGVHTHPSTHIDLSQYPVEEFRKRDSLKDYPEDIQRGMIRKDFALITQHVGGRPTAFRAGAMCSGPATQKVLSELGLTINSSYRFGINLIGWCPFSENGVIEVPTYSSMSPKQLHKWPRILVGSRALRFLDTLVVLYMHPTEFALYENSLDWFEQFVKTIKRYGFGFSELREVPRKKCYAAEQKQIINRIGLCAKRAIYAIKQKPLPQKSGQDHNIEYDNLIWNIRRGGNDIVLSNEYIQCLTGQGYHIVYKSVSMNQKAERGLIFGRHRQFAKGLICSQIVVGDLFGECLDASDGEVLKKILSDFEEECRRKRIPKITIYTQIGGLDEYGYQHEVTHTALADIAQDDESLMGRMRQETRTRTRKALKSDLELEEATSRDLFDVFHNMRVETMKRSSLRAEGREFYDSVYDLIQQSMAKVFLVRISKGNYVSGGLFYFNRDTVYFWKGASLKEGWPYCANNMLHWHLMCWARDAGYKRYNMVGADMSQNSPTAGITRFKLGLGGKIVPVNVYTKVLSRKRQSLVSMAKAVKRLAARSVRLNSLIKSAQ